MEKNMLLFVINPHSGSTDNSNLHELIEKVCEAEKCSYQILDTTGENDRNMIKAKIEEHNPNTVIAAGGDGTINLVASLLINTNVRLGILPTGSANGLAYNLNITTNYTDEIKKIIDGKAHSVDTLLINNQFYSIHLSDIGINARLIKRFEEDNTRGLFGYAKQLMNELKEGKKVFKAIIDTDDKSYQIKAEMILLANAKSFGTGAIINPKGKVNDGICEIIVLKPYPWWSIFSLFTKMFTGKINHLKYIQTIQTTKAHIRLNIEQIIQADGEVLGKKQSVTIQTLPQSLNIIY